MSDGSAMKTSRTEHSSEAWRERSKREREREQAVPPSSLFDPAVLGSGGGTSGGSVCWEDNAHPSDRRFLELWSLKQTADVSGSIGHRGRARTAHLELSKSWRSWSPSGTCAPCVSSLSAGRRAQFHRFYARRHRAGQTRTRSWTHDVDR